ncbi:hypothetical protein BD311DRAFT_769436 [Dichomitus squalens]|uniref:Uncharacterized protein n=1 Tax=Dichomitus squalens TaxID=114155 RepID=A0A4Q9M7J6_9APHY|nr:hypothetical protein BD311DRAFT_769436 [Dichomitus squalens]
MTPLPAAPSVCQLLLRSAEWASTTEGGTSTVVLDSLCSIVLSNRGDADYFRRCAEQSELGGERREVICRRR